MICLPIKLFTKRENVVVADSVGHCVAALQQRHGWDCGVTCVLMLLPPTQCATAMRDLDAICQDEGFGHSTWTIDLCYLLKRFNIEHTMYTINLGVNKDFHNYKYYRKIIEQDRARVERRFSAAAARGLRVLPARLPLRALAAHLPLGPALLLVDATRLRCARCGGGGGGGGGYAGHYVVVTGAAGGRLQYRDPARACRDRAPCAAPPRRLQRARTPATDEDVILIHRAYR